MTAEVVNLREPVSAALRQKVSEDAGWRCHYCNRVGQTFIGPDERPWNIDHKLAVSRGGKSNEANLALACERCNVSKRNRDYDEFVAYARTAYWVEDSAGIHDAALDMLAKSWLTVSAGVIEFRTEPDPEIPSWGRPVVERVRRLADGSLDEASRVRLAEGAWYGESEVGDLFRFLELAYRHMPALLDAAQKGVTS